MEIDGHAQTVELMLRLLPFLSKTKCEDMGMVVLRSINPGGTFNWFWACTNLTLLSKHIKRAPLLVFRGIRPAL
jgi:hypothetical protein